LTATTALEGEGDEELKFEPQPLRVAEARSSKRREYKRFMRASLWVAGSF
jgi:hypothetical protein